MKLTIYKGFESEFFKSQQEQPLVASEISRKKNVIDFDSSFRKELAKALLSLDKDDSAWVTYEEYTLIKKIVDEAIKEDSLVLKVFRNNLYPDYYPIEFFIPPELATEIIAVINGDTLLKPSENCKHYLAVYNTLVEIDGVYYGSFYNYEYECENEENIKNEDFYPYNINIEKNITFEEIQSSDIYEVFINEDIDTYLRDLNRISELSPKIIEISSTDGEVAKRIQKSLQAYCMYNQIQLVKSFKKPNKGFELEQELISIAQMIFVFPTAICRKIWFYKTQI